jgi:hypothetical protein
MTIAARAETKKMMKMTMMKILKLAMVVVTTPIMPQPRPHPHHGKGRPNRRVQGKQGERSHKIVWCLVCPFSLFAHLCEEPIKHNIFLYIYIYIYTDSE